MFPISNLCTNTEVKCQFKYEPKWKRPLRLQQWAFCDIVSSKKKNIYFLDYKISKFSINFSILNVKQKFKEKRDP